MKLEQIGSKNILISTNHEKEIYKDTHYIQVGEDIIDFSYSELKALQDVENELLDKNLILSSIKGLVKGLITYKNEDGLTIYVKETPEYIIIFAIGEYQPSLYKIYVESIFKKIG